MQGALLHLAIAAALVAFVRLVCAIKRLPPRETLALRLPPWGLFGLFLLGWIVLAVVQELASRALGLGDVTVWSMAPTVKSFRVLGVVIAAPVSEELVFRGLLFDRLSDGGRRP